MTSDTDRSNLRNVPRSFASAVEGTIPRFRNQTGRYSIDGGARSGKNMAVDYVAGCAQIDVMTGPTTRALSMRGGRGLGIPARWQWSELQPVSKEAGNPAAFIDNAAEVRELPGS